MICSKTLVVQPRTGIGDMIWHLSFIRAIAREIEGGPIYLLTHPKAQAKEWLYNEPSIEVIDYLDRRSLFLTGLRLRPQGFHSAWVLHQSASYALVPFIARAPERIGPGFGTQKYFLTNGPLNESDQKLSHIEQMDRLLAQQELTVRVEDQRIKVDPVAQAVIKEKWGHLKKPWITLGVGASEPLRAWSPENFARLVQQIEQRQKSTFFVCGSATECQRIQVIVDILRRDSIEVVAVDQLTIPQVFALLVEAKLFIGNDSGLMNASACLGVPSVGLFGASPVLTYSPFIHPITPALPYLNGKEGMDAISPAQVFAYTNDRQFLDRQINGRFGTA